MSQPSYTNAKAPAASATSFQPTASKQAQSRILDIARDLNDFRCAPLSAQPPLLQAKLTIGQAGDEYEREADRVADTVMRKGERGQPCPSAPASGGGQEEAEDDDKQQPAQVMAKATSGYTSPAASFNIASAISSARGKGEHLSAETRTIMEPRFGFDFSSVRIHADRQADTLNRDLSAEAFTVGRDVYFREGRYAPGTYDGRSLLAHELTHVIQQQDDSNFIQCYSLSGFSPTQETAMRTAIPIASSTVRSRKANWRGRRVANKVDSANYVYDSDENGCAWTLPFPWANIRIKPHAFDASKCCKLESTIAHEAWHTWFGMESGADKLECACFGCSC